MVKPQQFTTPFLGEEQWAWLDKVFKETHDDLYIIGSGIQILQNIVSLPKEVWPPQEKHRLFTML